MASQSPMLFLSLPAGALADRLNRRDLLRLTHLVRMALLAGWPCSSRRLGHILVVYAAALALERHRVLEQRRQRALSKGGAGRSTDDRPTASTTQCGDQRHRGPAIGGLLAADTLWLPLAASRWLFSPRRSR